MESDSLKASKILIVEDDLVNIKLLEAMLSKSSLPISEVISAESLKAAVELLDNDDIDVVLLDLNLSDSIGLDTLVRVGKYSNVAIVVVTGEYDDELGLEAVTKGAHEYLMKGKYDVQILSKSIHYAIQRKQAEKSLKLAYKELDNAHKKLKETQSQLIQNEKLASIGQLAAGIAHEMNTPVGFVASNFETLKNYVNKFENLITAYEEFVEQFKTTENTELIAGLESIKNLRKDLKIDFLLEDIKELFDESQEGLERVTGIIQNLRDFSRIDQAGDFAEYNLNEGIKSTLVVVKNEIKYDCSIKTEFTEVPLIFCNPGQINQVFLNVLINAAQAIKSQKRNDEKTITIKTYTADREVVCEISDNGPGIVPDKLSKVFDPFFTTKPVGKGTGLGLSVSHDIIVNKHKGHIFVDSIVGQGAKFTIKLPIDCKNKSEKGDTEIREKADSIIC